jgi:hypothetical protein
MNILGRIVRAREALEDGDIAFAAEILADLEIDLAGGFRSTVPCSNSCPDCGRAFRWPGQLADHRDLAHWQEAA